MEETADTRDRPEDHLLVERQAPSDRSLTVRLDGDLDPFTAPLLVRAIDEQLADVDQLRLDVTRLRFIDSSGLRVLVMAHNTLAERGGEVVLEGVSDSTRRILEIAGLADSFTLRS